MLAGMRSFVPGSATTRTDQPLPPCPQPHKARGDTVIGLETEEINGNGTTSRERLPSAAPAPGDEVEANGSA